MIALERCSNPQKIWQVFASTMKNNLVLGFGFFACDRKSAVVLAYLAHFI